MCSPNPLDGFLCNSFFRRHIDLSALDKSFFQLTRGLRFPKKIKFFLDKFYMELHFGSRCEEDALDSWSVLLYSPSERGGIDYILWRCEFVKAVWSDFF